MARREERGYAADHIECFEHSNHLKAYFLLNYILIVVSYFMRIWNQLVALVNAQLE